MLNNATESTKVFRAASREVRAPKHLGFVRGAGVVRVQSPERREGLGADDAAIPAICTSGVLGCVYRPGDGSRCVVADQTGGISDDIVAIVADDELLEGSSGETGGTMPILDVENRVGEAYELPSADCATEAGHDGDLVFLGVKMHLEIVRVLEETFAFGAIVVLCSKVVV